MICGRKKAQFERRGNESNLCYVFFGEINVFGVDKCIIRHLKKIVKGEGFRVDKYVFALKT